MTLDEMCRALAPIALACQKEIDEHHGMVFYGVLKGVSLEHFDAAVSRYLFTAKDQFLPMPGLLLQYADEAAHGVEMTADQAIGLVWHAVKKHQGYDADCHRAAYADLGPKIVAAMKAAGGYQRFCDCESGDKSSLTAQFREAWNASVRREEQYRRLPTALLPRVNGPATHAAIEHSAPALIEQKDN